MNHSEEVATMSDLLNEWQVAPSPHEIAYYDEIRIKYRQSAAKLVESSKGLQKKALFMISTNVLCADLTSKDASEPEDKDIYLPLEIAITKWTLKDAQEPGEKLVENTKLWMINPGPPTRGSMSIALKHRKLHKIEFDYGDDSQNGYTESPDKVMKEINGFLSPDRTVFSLDLKHCRQDLGSLKWLNRASGYKAKPIKVYSLEDLYVVLARQLKPAIGTAIGQGVARHRMTFFGDQYDIKIQCHYHKASAKNENGECRFCAKAVCISYIRVLLKDMEALIGSDDLVNALKEVKKRKEAATT